MLSLDIALCIIRRGDNNYAMSSVVVNVPERPRCVAAQVRRGGRTQESSLRLLCARHRPRGAVRAEAHPSSGESRAGRRPRCAALTRMIFTMDWPPPEQVVSAMALVARGQRRLVSRRRGIERRLDKGSRHDRRERRRHASR